MTVKVGDRVPEVKLMHMTGEGPKPITTSEVFGGKKVVMFAVPGAFTPTCSARHLPGYIERHRDLVEKGVDTVACVSVNDAFVMSAWGKAQEADGKVQMLADGNGELAKAMGLELDATANGLGIRSRRYALIAVDGVIEALEVETAPGLNVSSAESILAKLG